MRKIKKKRINFKDPSKSWIFVIFKRYAKHLIELKTIIGLKPEINYLSYQLEKTKKGKPHIQGFIRLKKSIRYKKLKRFLNSKTVHVEPCREDLTVNANYTSKGASALGNRVTVDNRKKGERSDIKDLYEDIRNHKSIKYMWEHHLPSMIRYHVGILKAIAHYAIRRNFKTRVTVIYGNTDLGKSRMARLLCDPSDTYNLTQVTSGQQFWEGYEGEKYIIINEYYGWVKFSLLLDLLDENPVKVPTKGGFVEFSAKRIIITSNKGPLSWYNWERIPHTQKIAFIRRIESVVEFYTRTDWRIVRDKGHQQTEIVWNNDLNVFIRKELNKDPEKEEEEEEDLEIKGSTVCRSYFKKIDLRKY